MNVVEFVESHAVGVSPAGANGAGPRLSGTGVVTRRADGTRMRTVPGVLDELARAWEFPEHFGRNRDALDDCMRDLPDDRRAADGGASSGFLTVVDGADELLADGSADDREWLAESFEFWHEHYASQGRRFAVLLVGADADVWRRAGVPVADVGGRD